MNITEIKHNISGPVPSIRTPFLKNGDIDWKGLDNQVEFLIEKSKAKTLLVTNGDSLLTVMNEAEVAEVNKRVVDRAKGRAMVIACGKFWNYQMGIDFIKYAKEIGADVGIAPIVDWAHSAGDDESYECIRETGKIMPVMILTNLVNGRGIQTPVYKRLIREKTPGFIGVKDDMCGDYGKKLAGLLDDRYAFLSGGLAINHLEVAPYGADGYLSIFASFYPELCHEYWDLFTKNDYRSCGKWIVDNEKPYLAMIAENGFNFDAVSHGMMEIAGVCGRYRRAPYSSVTDEQMEILKDYAKKIKMI